MRATPKNVNAMLQDKLDAASDTIVGQVVSWATTYPDPAYALYGLAVSQRGTAYGLDESTHELYRDCARRLLREAAGEE